MQTAEKLVDRWLHEAIPGLPANEHAIAHDTGHIEMVVAGTSQVPLTASRRVGRFHLPVRRSACVAAHTEIDFVCGGRGITYTADAANLITVAEREEPRTVAFCFVGRDALELIEWQSSNAADLKRFVSSLEALRERRRSELPVGDLEQLVAREKTQFWDQAD